MLTTKGDAEMSVTEGSDYQVEVGRGLAAVRATLGLQNAMMAEAMSNHSPNGRITPSRVSEAEHGRANLGRQYVAIVKDLLEARGVPVPDVIAAATDHLPDIPIGHMGNEGAQGNSYNGPRESPLTVVREGAKRKTKAPAKVNRNAIVATLDEAGLVITTAGVTIRVHSFSATVE